MQHLLKFTKLAAFAGALIFLASCDKSGDEVVSGTAKISVTHASPDAPALNVFVDNTKITPAALTFTGTTGVLYDPYVTVNAGTRNVSISDGVNNVTQGAIPFASNGVYSIFAFDTLSATSTLKGLVLQDNLSLPAAGKAHIRFLHLSPDAGNIDIDFAKVNDTTKITGKPYLGASASTDPNISNFSPINAGAYDINFRQAGTTPVILSSPFTFVEGKIYTVYASGLRASPGTPQALGASIIIHN